MNPLTPQQLEAFVQDLGQAAADRGVIVTGRLVQDALAGSIALGFNPQATRQALDTALSGPTGAAYTAPAGGYLPEPEPADDYGEDFEYESEPEPASVRSLVEEFIDPAVRNVTRDIGRPLTARESATLNATATEHADRGSLDEAGIRRDSGVKPWDEMSRPEQARVMAERVRDQQPDPNAGRVFDLAEPENMTRNDWDTYLTMRAQGVEFDVADED